VQVALDPTAKIEQIDLHYMSLIRGVGTGKDNVVLGVLRLKEIYSSMQMYAKLGTRAQNAENTKESCSYE
jgi:hypothetical protein